MTEIDNRINSLLFSTDNSLRLCTQYQQKTIKIVNDCKDKGKKIKQAKEILFLLKHSFIEQLEVLVKIYGLMNMKNKKLENHYSKDCIKRTKIYSNLSNIFNELQNQIIDPSFSSVPKNSNLFHFVDIDTVDSLKKELNSDLSIIEKQSSVLNRSLCEFKKRLSEVDVLIKNIFEEECFNINLLDIDYQPNDKEDSNISFVNQYIHIMETDLNAITSILISVTTLSDQIKATKNRFLRTGQEELYEFQLQSLESSAEQVRGSTEKAYECLNRIIEKEKSLTKLCASCNNPFESSNVVKQKLQELSFIVDNANDKILNLERTFIELRPNIIFYCKELENLYLWYKLYNTGYNELLFEIQRRETQRKNEQNLIKLIEIELKRTREEEKQKRESFMNEHGSYLPSSLCPILKEPVVNYSIHSDIIPTPIPKLIQKPQRKIL